MPTKSISEAVNLIEMVRESSAGHRSMPKPMLRPRHRVDSRDEVVSMLSSTLSDTPRSRTAFICTARLRPAFVRPGWPIFFDSMAPRQNLVKIWRRRES